MAGGKHGVYNASLTGDWAKLGDAFANLSVRFPQAMQAALVEEGEFYRRKIVEGIRQQAPGGLRFKPLSPVTLALRKLLGFGGTKALIRTGELRNNVVTVAKQDEVFVGVLYASRGADGRSLADIGRLHEYGGVVRSAISRARMRLIAQALRKAGLKSSGGMGGQHAGLGMVRIPARPFIRPVIEMYGGKRGAERFMARVARKLGGLLGVINHPDLPGRSLASAAERFAGGATGRSLKMARTGRGQRLRKTIVKLKRPQKFKKPKRVIAPKFRKPKVPRVAKVRVKKPRFSKKLIGATPKIKMRKYRMVRPRITRKGPRRAWKRPPLPRKQQHNAHVKAYRKQNRKKNPQQNAHVKAFRKHVTPQHNAHVKAFQRKRSKANPQQSAHVKAHRAPHSAHVKAFRKNQREANPQHNAHVKAHRANQRKAARKANKKK